MIFERGYGRLILDNGLNCRYHTAEDIIDIDIFVYSRNEGKNFFLNAENLSN